MADDNSLSNIISRVIKSRRILREEIDLLTNLRKERLGLRYALPTIENRELEWWAMYAPFFFELSRITD